MGTSTLIPIPIANSLTSPAYQKASDGFKTFAFEILGAPVSFINRFFQGFDHMQEGDMMKAMAKFTPGLISNVVTGIDILLDDRNIKTREGYDFFEMSYMQIFGRMLGFTPLALQREYEKRNSVNNAMYQAMEYRGKLIDAIIDGDLTLDSEEVSLFNSRNPDYAIKRDTVKRSIKAKEDYQENLHEYGAKSGEAKKRVGRL